MSRRADSPDSPTGLTEFGPLTPEERPQGYGFSLSRLLGRVRGATRKACNPSEQQRQQQQQQDQADSRRGSEQVSPSDTQSEAGPSWLEKDANEAGSEAGALGASGSSSQDSILSSRGAGAVAGAVGGASHHDRTLPNVLTRIRNILDNRGSTPQQYKDSDFKQYWLPDSVSRECYECEEKFTTFRRRHHCRVCGQIFCSRCCNSMIPGKVIGYTGELRVCTYCCKVVLSYLQSSNLAADVLADLRALMDDLLPNPVGQPIPGAGNNDFAAYGSLAGNGAALATPRGTLRRHSLGFQEEKYVAKTRYASGDLQAFGVQRDNAEMSALQERQLLLRDSQQLHSLWSQMTTPVSGLPFSSHRHRLKAYHNCLVGRDLVRWLLANDKASSRAAAVAIGQALLEAGYILCITQIEQVFVDDYVLYRPLRQGSGDQEGAVQEDFNYSQEVGQEPLWVKQIPSVTEEGPVSPLDPSVGGLVYQDPGYTVETPTVETPSSITSSTSNYCLDFNLQDHVVSIRKPQATLSPGDSTDSRGVAASARDVEPSYSTTVSAALSASALLIPPGDAAVMAEVLQGLRGQDGMQPQSELGAQEKSSSSLDVDSSVIKQRLKNGDPEKHLKLMRFSSMWASHESALLCQLLDSGGLSPSWAEVILPIVHTVTDIIRPDVRNDSDDMDIRQYVQFKKVPGGSRSDCQIVNGAVCTKNVADRAMAMRLTDPQILLVGSTIDYQRGTDNKLLSFDNLLLQEANYLQNVVAKIASYKPDIILVEKSIAFLARKYLQTYGITLVINVKPSVMERVARCTQAELVTSIDAQLTRPTLGMCHNFYVRSYSLGSKGKAKTLMFFDGCATHLGCTVILRGASNAELKRVKMIMNFMIYAVYNWKLERSFLVDEHTYIAPLPSESFDLEDREFEDADDGGDALDRAEVSVDSVLTKRIGEVVKGTEASESDASVDDVFLGAISVTAPIDTASGDIIDTPVDKDVTSEAQKVSSKDGRDDTEKPGMPVPTIGLFDKAKLTQTVSDFSDPLHSYLNSGASPQETPLEPPRGAFSLTEEPLANTFRKALDETILSCSPYIRYSIPYLETEAGQNCLLRRFFQRELYQSVLFEKDNLMRRPKFSEMESKSTTDTNKNVHIKDVHLMIKLQITTGAKEKEFQAVLADFRARGGRVRNVCTCETTSNDVYHEYCNISVGRAGSGTAVVMEEPTSQTEESGLSGKGNTNTSWSGQSCMMLTASGRVDALHPFNHQRLSLLFSSFAPSTESGTTPVFCVNPWMLTMDFYGRNDITLGAFLERYCFSPTYTCPSHECSVPVHDHIRKFVHEAGCVDVVLRKLDSDMGVATPSSIHVWSWCKVCKQLSPVQPLSLESWSFSFAKYLELRFYGGSFNRRGNPGCSHSIHHDHYQYFGYKNHVAVFKYNPVTLREVVLPPSQMKLSSPPISQTSIVELIKGVAVQGYSVFSTILEKVTTLLSECGSRWEPLIVEISEHQNSQRSKFRESIESIQLQLTSPTLEARRLHPPTPSTTAELTSTMLAITDQITLLKKLIAQVVNEWNTKVQDLVQLRKKEEKLEKAKTLASVGGGGMLPRQSTSTSMSTSSAVSAHTTTPSGEMHSAVSHKQSVDSGSVASSAAMTGLSTESLNVSSLSEAPGQEAQKSPPVYVGGEVAEDEQVAETSSSPQSNDAKKPLSVEYVSPSAESLREERDRILQALTSLTACTHRPPRPKTGQSAQSLSSVSSDALQMENEGNGGLPQQLSDAFSVVHRRQASDTCEGLVSGSSPTAGSPGRGHERSLSDGGQASSARDSVDRVAERRLASTAVKNIISTFWPSSNLLVESPFPPSEHYLLLPEIKIPVVVHGEEPSSIIAHALASQEYEKQLEVVKKRLKDFVKECLTAQRQADQSFADVAMDSISSADAVEMSYPEPTDPELIKASKNFHIELQGSDQHAKFYCKLFFPEHFRQLRKLVFPYGEENFIRSLSRCMLWEARGGKSGSIFIKSSDDRFVLKEMSRFEISSFLDFGRAYVRYMINCEKEKRPTVLTKILGVYRIGYKNTTTNKAQKMDLLVMENLFYQRNITHKFDLKGSIRNRLVNTCGKEESDLVLLDENLLRMACSNPLYVRPHSKAVLSRAIGADTSFLSQQLIMDYSLLVGIDTTANELIVGIIDYIRTFTWDKKLETIFKGSMLGGGGDGKLPTVVSPEIYRTRFCHAMDRYFLLSPDRWMFLGSGVDI
ncbi:1-phosphatidylinositol 3-phosphate 5-kinase-like isoform X2 [Eriocheir sinensis]|uniref:1-phosphatidylinositol 3-phosphate 5-kinase-like isoform X2 n=1 Tax=Eriocheir sinensis TaxID=95602 RepID=UPI0021C8A61D|nr:1-phosphatidylinositol 3-phosphate 5-kinase-like isoform X2 [Eriocheir sinensis]